MSVHLGPHQVAWAWSGVLSGATLVATIGGITGNDWSGTHVVIACLRVVVGISAAALLAYGLVVRRLTSDERVLSAVVEQLEDSDAFSTDGVTNGRVVSLNGSVPASRTSAVPRPTGGRPFGVAHHGSNGSPSRLR